jgi:hypothetical protein
MHAAKDSRVCIVCFIMGVPEAIKLDRISSLTHLARSPSEVECQG